MDSWLGQFGTRHGDDDARPLLSEERVTPRGGGTEAAQAFRRGEHMGRVGFDPRSFPAWDVRSPVSHHTCDVPFPPRRTGEYWKGMISAALCAREFIVQERQCYERVNPPSRALTRPRTEAQRAGKLCRHTDPLARRSITGTVRHCRRGLRRPSTGRRITPQKCLAPTPAKRILGGFDDDLVHKLWGCSRPTW